MFLCVHMRVVMCDCDCVHFYVRLGLRLLPLLDQLRPPNKCGAYFLPATLPSVAGVSAHWCIGGFLCLGLGALECAGLHPVAACWVLGPLALSGPCLGGDVPQGLGSLGPWLDLHRCRRLQAGPVGLSLLALWLLHCGCWVVPLGLFSALPWGFAVVLMGFPLLGL
ncbi:hypothetical protein ATANTOWER_001329 [Ataeniobius toweri]|uniref:Uncharacterized protein n=1 Tax=Ataeniobius toweri TaxID=208326 RepID=A0ABU7C8A6_9TELE|nr:hypothetical protein [Ataeniobius toweri]